MFFISNFCSGRAQLSLTHFRHCFSPDHIHEPESQLYSLVRRLVARKMFKEAKESCGRLLTSLLSLLDERTSKPVREMVLDLSSGALMHLVMSEVEVCASKNEVSQELTELAEPVLFWRSHLASSESPMVVKSMDSTFRFLYKGAILLASSLKAPTVDVNATLRALHYFLTCLSFGLDTPNRARMSQVALKVRMKGPDTRVYKFTAHTPRKRGGGGGNTPQKNKKKNHKQSRGGGGGGGGNTPTTTTTTSCRSHTHFFSCS